MAFRRCAIYARISVSHEASVSIERQIEAGKQYASARGWEVVGTFVDDGVSATHNKPEARTGWRALLVAPEKFDAVVIWKLDRLARRVLDFHLANKALNERGAGLVAVENAVDMTTPDGRLYAGMLAQFAEYEAEAISARVRAARAHLLRSGRVVGGAVPYGWKSIPNPDGPGFVLAQDAERINYVLAMADRVGAGESVYSVMQWLDEVGAPLPTVAQKRRISTTWSYTTVERLLRNPILAGMTPFNPGNSGKARGDDVLRDDTGLPVVDESVAIMSAAEWRALLKKLDGRDSPQSRPRATKGTSSALLSGLLVCGEHGNESPRMWRGKRDGKLSYYCPSCHQTMTNFEDVVVEEFLRQKGERVRWSVVEEVHEGGAALLPEIENRLDELDRELREAADRDLRRRLQLEQANLLDLRDEKRAQSPEVTLRAVRHTQTFAEDWKQADGVNAQRAILADAMSCIRVFRGPVGRPTRASKLQRLNIEWCMPNDLGPPEQPDNETLAAWAADNPVPRRRHPQGRR